MSDQEEVRRLADLRQWLEERIKGMEEELELTRRMLGLVDEQLRKGSFVKATEVPIAVKEASREGPREEEVVATEVGETKALRRQNDNYLIANAYVQGNTAVIVPVTDVTLRASTPPFKSYLMGKVFAGMKKADEEAAAQGKPPRGGQFSYDVKEEGGRITKLTLTNFNDKARLNEALSTTLWTFTKMLEKQS